MPKFDIKHRYNVGQMLLSMLTLRGGFYPGIFLNRRSRIYDAGEFGVPYPEPHDRPDATDFPIPPAPEFKALTSTGAELYGIDPTDLGVFYFMPVKLDGTEIPAAVISISGRKTIVETAIVGARGTVKELISVDDYNITLMGVLYNDERIYPEKEIRKIREIYEKNEAIKLTCALTDMLFPTDEVVIRSIEFPAMDGVEDMQTVRMELVTDSPFELTIE